MLPRQGGTNSRVMIDMAHILRKEGKRQFLKAHWYVAKDREVPIDAAARERNCHGTTYLNSARLTHSSETVKFCCIDGQVTILGNGNQGLSAYTSFLDGRL